MGAPQSQLPVGFLTDEQRRRVQALSIACALFPGALNQTQVQIARWIITGRWEQL